MTDQTNNNDREPILTFEGKKYQINILPDETKELLKGLQAADNQLRLYEETLKVLAVGRQSLASQLKQALEEVKSLN